MCLLHRRLAVFARASTRFARLVALLGLLLLVSCASLPTDFVRPPDEYAMSAAESGVLAEMAAAISDSRGAAQSGFSLLDRNADALRWRLALVDSAVSSLDLMYYLWYGHDSGRLLLKRVIEAAERGVKVRLLVDDLLLIGDDQALVALDRHPNIQLRLFNPKRQRKLGMVTDTLWRFGEMNSRMHNKLLVADNHAAILGGRNIGDYYFGLSSSYNFHDLDVLGFGPVARQSSDMFDNFWNSTWVVPAAVLPASVSGEQSQERFERLLVSLEASDRLEVFPVEPIDWSASLQELLTQLHYGSSEIVFDRFDNGDLVRGMTDPLGAIMRSAEHDIRLMNAYIIPEQDFVDAIRTLTERGVEVRILTNSLSSHDVPAVNSHYRKWRKPLIEAGAELYEWRADPAIKPRVDTAPVQSKFTGLHTKAFVVDGRHVFIGSMNFDPRSVDINTEMGIIIDSAGLGREMQRQADRDMAPENAWRVALDDEGRVLWVNSDETVTRQPARNAWQRVMDGFFKLLPKSQF
jgi:putative cardiolipin synthase